MMGDKRNILGNLVLNRQVSPNQKQDQSDSNSKQSFQTKHRPTSGASSASGRQHKLKQRFSVIKKLGKGTYGKVQLAINKETGQEVAIKTIKKSKIENEQDLERVRREIQIMSSIEHPHIIHIYEVFENKDKIVLVMQYAPGGELYEYVSQEKLLDDREARRIFRQIATAIYYCHQNKICHRDLKLENILLDEKNNAKLADFGLSNVFDKSYQLKTFCGSPLYASPEIVQGSPYEGPEVDCWSLGVLLYTLVYGSMPFDGSNFKRLVKQISEASYFEPKERSQASPLIRKLLCADPVHRATIIDICTDPWVNRASISPAPRGSRSSPPAMGHNSLLKVAQDMASLTPVRLDILTSIAAPTQPVVPPRPSKRSLSAEEVPSGAQTETSMDTIESQVAGTAISAPSDEPNPHNTEQMFVDEEVARPVASFVVRDLEPSSPTPEEDQMDTASRASPVELALEIHQEPVKVHQIEDEPQQQEQDSNMQVDERPSVESQLADSLLIGQVDESNVARDQEPNEVADQPDRVQGVNSEELQADLSAPFGIGRADDDIHEPKISKASDQNKQDKIEVVAADKEDQESHEAEQKEVDEPKKKKKIVVVKKKRKGIVKKPKGEPAAGSATGDEDDKQEHSDKTQAKQTLADAGTSKARKDSVGQIKVSKVSRKSVVGKIQIPETFSKATSGTGSSGMQTPTLPKIENRRQSALIADVSQRLIQQLQADASSQGSAAVIEEQAKLQGIVRDHKDEFERRASLAMLEQPSAPIRKPTKDTDESKEQPNESLALVEETKEHHHVEEQQQHLPLPEASNIPEEAPLAHVGLLKDQVEADNNCTRDTRSDSLETVKAKETATPGIVGSQAFEWISNTETPKVRTNYELKMDDNTEASKAQLSPAALSATTLGPVPITRSYKKVTFTKDGACITEMGKIYSTKTSDGTLKRVERKSKITHYPALSPSGELGDSAGPHVRVKSVSKSEIQEAESGNFWQSKQQHREESTSGNIQHSIASASSRAFERLILPTGEPLDLAGGSGFEEDEDNEDEEEFFFRSSPFLTSEAQRQHRRKQQQADSNDAASSCSSESTDIFDDNFDTWTGAISMFKRHGSGSLFGSLRRDQQQRLRDQWQPFPRQKQTKTRSTRPVSSLAGTANIVLDDPFVSELHQKQQQQSRQRPGDPFSAFNRPGSAFGDHRSLRGSMFGSKSNLFFTDTNLEAPFDEQSFNDHQDNDDSLDIHAEIDRKHAKLKETIAKQHKQLWKGSTPSLFTGTGASFARDDPIVGDIPSNSAPSRRETSTGQQASVASERQATCLRKASSVARSVGEQELNQSQSASSNTKMRQSIALNDAPIRRNTANINTQLPPKPQHQVRNQVYRTVSKTSLLSSQFATMQMGPNSAHQEQQSSLEQSEEPNKQQPVASFIELKRTLSNSSNIRATDPGLTEDTQRQQVQSVQTKTITTITTTRTSSTAGGRTVSTSGSNSALWDVSSDRHQRAGDMRSPVGFPPSLSPSRLGNLHGSGCNESQQQQQQQQQFTERDEADSRIQNWLQESASNLSSSSGSCSKSSVSCSTSQHDPFNSLYGSLNLRLQGPSRLASTSETNSQLPPRRPSPINDLQAKSRAAAAEEMARRIEQQVVTTSSSVSAADGLNRTIETRTTTKTIQLKASDSELRLPSNQQQVNDNLDWTRTSHHTMEASDSARDDTSSFGPTDFDSQSHSNSSSYLLDQLKSLGYRSMINQRMDQSRKTSPSASSGAKVASPSGSPEFGGSQSASSRQTVLTSAEQQQQPNVVTDEDSGISLNQQLAFAQPDGPANLGAPTAGSADCDQCPRLTAAAPSTEANISNDMSNGQSVVREEPSMAAENKGRQGTLISFPLDNDREQETMAPRVGSEVDDEQDEDIKEARASIQAYLDRVKETELFLKSCHEEEEQLIRQRQELFLFNNLMFTSKLGGGGSTASASNCNFTPSSPLDEQSFARPQPDPAVQVHSAAGSLGHPYSMNGCATAAPASTLAAGFRSAPVKGSDYQQAAMGGYHWPKARASELRVNEFFSSLGGLRYPAGIGGYSGDADSPSSFYGPNGSQQFPSSYRSISMLHNDEPSSVADGPSYTRPSYARRSRPLSASIDSYDSPLFSSSLASRDNCQLASRVGQFNSRRSVSQIRQTPSTAPVQACNSVYMSEYQRAYCIPRAPSPDHPSDLMLPLDVNRFQKQEDKQADSIIIKQNDYAAADDDDDDMEAYRPSAYVPKVVPIGETASTRQSRRSYTQSRRSDRFGSLPATASSFELDRSQETAGDQVASCNNNRRVSLQLASLSNGNGTYLSDTAATDELSSWHCSKQTTAELADQSSRSTNSNSNSRLGELEQRIQANRRRREQLLANSKSDSPSGRKLPREGGNSGPFVGAADNERTTTTLGAADGGQDGEDGNCASRGLTVDGQTTASKAYKPPSIRPSRLESMEARIKRKSYYVRVAGPSQPTNRLT